MVLIFLGEKWFLKNKSEEIKDKNKIIYLEKLLVKNFKVALLSHLKKQALSSKATFKILNLISGTFCNIENSKLL